MFLVWERRQGPSAILPLDMLLTGDLPGVCLEAVRHLNLNLLHVALFR